MAKTRKDAVQSSVSTAPTGHWRRPDAESIDQALALRPETKPVLYQPDGTVCVVVRDDMEPRANETAFAELPDGTVVEMIRHHYDARRIQFAVLSDGQISYADWVAAGADALVPIKSRHDILNHLVLPTGATPYESPRQLVRKIRSAIKACVGLPNPYPSLLAAYCLYTWLSDRLSVAVYVFVTGLPESGKTTLLHVLRLFCRRSLSVAEASAASVYTNSSLFSPTFIFDEEDFGGRAGRQLRRLARAGSTRDQVVLRRGACWDIFGPKIFCAEDLPDDPALLRRCIIVPMTESDTAKRKKPDHPDILQMSREVQNQCLALRFHLLKGMRAVTVPGADHLSHGRRDLLSALAAPFADDPEWQELLLQCLENTEQVWMDSRSPVEAAVLDGLWAACHLHLGFHFVYTLELVNLITEIYKNAGQEIHVKTETVGKIVSKVGIRANHTNSGNGFWLNERNRTTIHKRVKKYGLNLSAPLLVRDAGSSCRFCASFLTDSKLALDADLVEDEKSGAKQDPPESPRIAAALRDVKEVKDVKGSPPVQNPRVRSAKKDHYQPCGTRVLNSQPRAAARRKA